MKTNQKIGIAAATTALIVGAIAIVANLPPCPVPSGITGKVICVAPSGSDTNAGTVDAPFASITKAITASSAGDVILVGSGTYPAFTISKSNVTLIGINYPVVRGGTGIKCNANSKNVTIKGFEVIGAADTSFNGAIYLNGCSNSLVDGNKVHNNTGNLSGIIVNGNNNKITNNETYENGFSGIRIYGSSTGNEIAFNKSYNNTASGGNSDGIDLADRTVTLTFIHDNETFGNSDDGIDTWTSPGNIIQNNISHNNGGVGDGNGIKLGGKDTGGNNTVIGNISYANETSGFTSNGGGNTYESNIAYGNGEYGFSDAWRNAGNSMKSTFLKNAAYSNAKGNFHYLDSFLALPFAQGNNVETAVTFAPGTLVVTFTIPTNTPVISTATNIFTNTSIPPTVTKVSTNTPIAPTVTKAPPATLTPTIPPTSAISPTVLAVPTVCETAVTASYKIQICK